MASHRLNQPYNRSDCKGARQIHCSRRCVVLYKGGGHDDTRVGEVYFHAMLRDELLVCLSHWPAKREAKHWIKAVVSEEFSIIPSAWMLQPAIFTPAKVGQQSTVLVPAL